MTSFARWFTFNLVGAVGMAVQLTALALFNRLLHGHYLIASAAASEISLLHNFVWHTRFTWRDRRDSSSRRQQLLRFHLANGLLSLVGNIGLMRLLVHTAHLPVLPANAIAVVCCSAANFLFSHFCTFSVPHRTFGKDQLSVCAPVACLFLALPLVVSLACSQARAQLPDSPSVHPQSVIPARAETQLPNATSVGRSAVVRTYAYYGAAFCGMGASTSERGTTPSIACGAGISFPITPFFLELGVMGPQENRSVISGYLSADAKLPVANFRAGYAPLVIIGYSRLFETGHALDYGVGVETPRFGKAKHDASRAPLFELRDYWTFANPSQHNVMLRVGWTVGIPD